jgi:tRNA threonylcarbamoyladenosine biosynthesis protein TsaB
MRILALETTDKTGSVAVAEGGNVLLELELGRHQRSAQSLAPGIDAALKQAGWKPADVQLTAVTVGPGSFTGLRVGVTTAKVFAYAVGAEVLGIDTLETIAAAAPDDVTALQVVMDAQRGDVVARSFCRGDISRRLEPVAPQELLPIDLWLQRLVAGSVVSGPGLSRLLDRLPTGVVPLQPHQWAPRASQVARLAAQHYAAGRRDDLWRLAPIYVRRAAAEERWEAKGVR